MSSPNGNNHHVFMIQTTSPRVPVHNVNLSNARRLVAMHRHISPHVSPVRSVLVQSPVMGVPVSPQNRYSPYRQLERRRSLHGSLRPGSVVIHPAAFPVRQSPPAVRPVHFKVTAAGKMISPRHETRSFQPSHSNTAVRSGIKVVCRNCGNQSTDTEACHSCGKKIWKNGTAEKKDKSTISQAVEAGLKATREEIDRQSQKGIPSTSFYNGQESDFARYVRNSSTKSTTAKPARKRLNLVRNSTAAPDNVCITISSDSEDEEAKTTTVLSADPSTSNLSKIEEKNESPIKIAKQITNTSLVASSKESKPAPFVRTTKPCPVSESQPSGKSDDDLSKATLNFKIDFVRIGQLKLKATSVLRVSHDTLTMTTHCTHTDTDRILSIKWENVSSCEICSDIHEPCLYITLSQGALPQLRQQLQMEKGKFPYYDPYGEADEKFFIFYVNKSFILTATVASMEGLIRKIDLVRKKLKRPSTFLRTISFAESEERQTLAAAYMKEDIIKEDDNQNTSVQTPSISSSQEPTNAGNSLQVAAATPDKMTTRNRSKETPDLDCDFKIFTGPRIELFIYPPPPMKGGISVTNEDQFCLNEGEFLNDVIIEFYMKYVYNNILSDKDRERSHIFSCFFYERLMQKSKKLKDVSPAERRHSQVKKWTRNVDIFSKDFIFVPINEASHWYLAVICFPGMDGAAWELAMSDGTTANVAETHECQEVISTIPNSMRYLSEYGTNEGERSDVKGQENTEKTKESKTTKQTSEQVIESIQSCCKSEQQPREIPPTKSSGAAEKRKLVLVNLPNFTLRKKKSKLSVENSTNVANDVKIFSDDEKDSPDSSQNSQTSDDATQESESNDQAKLEETVMTESKKSARNSSETQKNDEAVISNPESSKPAKDILSSPKRTIPLTVENPQSNSSTKATAVKNEESIPVKHSSSAEIKHTTELSSPNRSTQDSESSSLSALIHNSIKQLSIPLRKVMVSTTKSPKKETLPIEDKDGIPPAPNAHSSKTQENDEVVISNPESSKSIPVEDKIAAPGTIEPPKKDPLTVEGEDSKVVELLPWLEDALDIEAVSDPPTPVESAVLDSSSDTSCSDTENMDCDDATRGSKCDAMQSSKGDAAKGSKDNEMQSSKGDAMQSSKHDAMQTSQDDAMQSLKCNAAEGSELENLQWSKNDDMPCSKLDNQSSKCIAELGVMQNSKHNAAHDATMDSEQDSFQGSKCDSTLDSEHGLIDDSMQGSNRENNLFELFVMPGSSGFALPKELEQKCTISPRRPEVRINRVPNKSPVRLKYLRACGTSTAPIRISSSSLSSDDSVIILSSPEHYSIEVTTNTDVQRRDMVPDQEKLSTSSLNLEFETSSHDLSSCDAIMQNQNNDSKVLSSPQHPIDDKQCRNTNCIVRISPIVSGFSETSLPIQAPQEKPGPSTISLSLQDSEKRACETTDAILVKCNTATVEDSVDTKKSECQVPNSSSNTTNKTVSSVNNKVANRQTCHNADNVENQAFEMIKSAENEGRKTDNLKETDINSAEGNSFESAKIDETSDSGVSPCKRASASEVEKTSSTVNSGNPKRNNAVAEVEASLSGEKLCDTGIVLGEEASGGVDKDPKHFDETAVKVGQVYKRPCILIFDSLRGPSRSKIATSLREYLTMEWKTRKQSTHGERVFDKDNLKMCSVVVPQQDNYTDCGLFLLHYVEKFFTKPIEKYHLPIKLENWFDPVECDKKRTDIKEVIDILNEEWIVTETRR